MENNTAIFRPEDVPTNFAVCFNTLCPRHGHCLRYVAGQVLAAHRNSGSCVYPTALRDGACPMFRTAEPMRLAWGFRPLFKDVRQADYDKVRWAVIFHFKSESDFWRYNRGYYKLTPRQQEEIFDIFRRHGYDPTNLRFAHYEERPDFQ